MFMYRVIRSVAAAGWLVLLAALLVVPVTFTVQNSSSRSGLLATLPGAVLTETLLVFVLLVGKAIRVRSRHDILAQLTDLRAAHLSFATVLDARTFRWLADKNKSRSLRFAPPSVVNVVASNAGLEFYWALQAHPLHLIHLIAWPEISSVTYRKNRWNSGSLIVYLCAAPAGLRFRIARTTLRSRNSAQVLAEALNAKSG